MPLCRVKKGRRDKPSAPKTTSQRQARRPNSTTDARRKHSEPAASARPTSKTNQSPQRAGRSRAQRSRPPPTASRPKTPQQTSGGGARRASPADDQRRREKRKTDNEHNEHPQKKDKRKTNDPRAGTAQKGGVAAGARPRVARRFAGVRLAPPTGFPPIMGVPRADKISQMFGRALLVLGAPFKRGCCAWTRNRARQGCRAPCPRATLASVAGARHLVATLKQRARIDGGKD